MGDTLYQLVYKSCYHGELYDDPRAISISPRSSACDILEIIQIQAPKQESGSRTAGCTDAAKRPAEGQKERPEEKNRHSFDGGIGSYFTDKAAAIAALQAL